MKALIPMAGAGSRFKDQGYKIPKPLLDVLSKPMVVSAADALPLSEEYIFVVRDFQIEEYQIDQHLKKYFPNSSIKVLDYLTEGQAVTCLTAKNEINNSEELVIGASDNGMIYDRLKFDLEKSDCDALVFTFRNNPSVLAKPEAYGWVVTESNNKVNRMSVKVPISETPMKDHAVVGTFWFRKGSIFVEATEKMMAENRRVNNEFYVDEMINDVIDLGYKVKVFEIEHYVCWGTPDDYETFKYWDEWFVKLENQGLI